MFTRPQAFSLTLLSILFFLGCISPPPIEPPPVSCTENWTCNTWSACTNGQQVRVCTEKNNCNNPQHQPILVQECTTPPIDNDFPISVTLGAEETVFNYATDHCPAIGADLDIPDAVAHAVRMARGGVMMSSGGVYFSYGPDFDHLKRSCNNVYQSLDDWNVEAFSPVQWLTSIYSDDGKTIHMLLHNEYHDPFSPLCKPGDTQPSNPCWYNFISYAKSTNNGKKFTQPTPPANLVAILPFQWNPNLGTIDARGNQKRPEPIGYMEPSNIVKKDDYYYATARTLPNPKGFEDTLCLMRTNTIEDPSSWKFWDGTDFTIPLTNPYPTPLENPSDFVCKPIVRSDSGPLSGNLTYNTYLQRYMIVGAAVLNNDQGKLTCGFWYILSDDLIRWGKPKLLRETVLGWSPCDQPTPAQQALSIDQEAYPGIIDHDSPSISFTTADNAAYLYWMQNQDNWASGGWGMRRNLVRAPITFTKK